MIRRLLLASTLTAGVAAQTAWPAPELLSGLIAEHGLTEAYDALRSRLGAAARLYGGCCGAGGNGCNCGGRGGGD